MLWSPLLPQHDRLECIAGYVTLLLSRIAEIMDRGVRAWRPQADAPQRPTAYLLARWGTSPQRALDLDVLHQLHYRHLLIQMRTRR
jgi:hypothetical protein